MIANPIERQVADVPDSANTFPLEGEARQTGDAVSDVYERVKPESPLVPMSKAYEPFDAQDGYTVGVMALSTISRTLSALTPSEPRIC
ncbi:hypothetical protein PC129_g20647 [Phytophthora cactorum]|uniref:Uncharacterized protein n=1 Tax=Phytophthora cactorum TaxID=29920 RepID=A0A8T1J6K3_9STRA|nr:hypothetical protein PC112_g21531 [Phytophthora cactorum]KAG2810497.1 hypothetical protein PC111_g15635 [Phytophthora cactorum]KAG2850409.1 hypothetical protein PC113_g16805 [Phytophthora cactorum]KAG2871292.1 hypothetical protein PC115_g24878 [Phytophthora cactorum]KAG2977592.1 hypothetical protein PC118_g12777 [Phytophthora cactorum]